MRTVVGIRCFLLVAGALASAPTLAKGPTYADFLVSPGFPPITPAQKSLTEVPSAAGAPAVALLKCQQITQELDLIHAQIFRIEYVRRIKILTQAGVEGYSDFRQNYFGNWRIQKVQARTVLPDGTEVDAKDTTFEDATAKGKGDQTKLHTVRVAFPRVQVGAILDLHLSLVADGTPFDRWVLQERIPVLESRYLLVIPDGLNMKIGSFLLTPDEQKQYTGRAPQGRYIGWMFQNEPAIPEEPNQPPLADISRALLVNPDSYKNENIYAAIAADWGSWAKAQKEDLDTWLKGKSEAVGALAKQVTEGATSPTQKAEAVRRALRSRIRFEGGWIGRTAETADDTLAQTSGTAGDLAALAVSMLKVAGVAATPLVFRDRDDGMLPKDAPIIPLLNDVVVRYAGDKGPEYMSPILDIAAGLLPRQARGVWAMPVDGTSTVPVLLPDYNASENRTARILRGSVDSAGRLTGELQITMVGLRGNDGRQELGTRDTEDRTAWVRELAQRFLPGAQVSDPSFENLDDDRKDLIVKAKLTDEHFATVAGKRLIANLNAFERQSAADWAAPTRQYPVDLGGAYEVLDTVMLSLPPEAADVAVPSPPASYDAGSAGRFTAAYEKRDQVVILKRTMRLDVYRFPASAYAGLKHWFGDIAAMDDRPVVVTLR
jgi:hypothetical protein